MKHNINFQCAIKKIIFYDQVVRITFNMSHMIEVWEENVRWMELNIFTTYIKFMTLGIALATHQSC